MLKPAVMTLGSFVTLYYVERPLLIHTSFALYKSGGIYMVKSQGWLFVLRCEILILFCLSKLSFECVLFSSFSVLRKGSLSSLGFWNNLDHWKFRTKIVECLYFEEQIRGSTLGMYGRTEQERIPTGCWMQKYFHIFSGNSMLAYTYNWLIVWLTYSRIWCKQSHIIILTEKMSRLISRSCLSLCFYTMY